MPRTSPCSPTWLNTKSPAGCNPPLLRPRYRHSLCENRKTLPMIEFAIDYGLFLAKAATVVLAIGLLVGWLVSAIHHARSMSQEQLEVRNINRRLRRMA